MKIGIVSDTHIPSRAKEIDKDFLDFLKDSDIIIHSGDINDYNVIELLKNYTSDIKVVKGNTDYLDLPKELFFELNGYKIFVFHSDNIYPRGNIELIYNYVINEKKLDPNIIIFGHSHIPIFTYYNGIYFINPGSLTGVRSGEIKNIKKSAAKLDLDNMKIEFKFKL